MAFVVRAGIGTGRSCLSLLSIAPLPCEQHQVLLQSHTQPRQTEDMDRWQRLEIQ